MVLRRVRHGRKLVAACVFLSLAAAPGAEAGARDVDLLRAAKSNADPALVRTLLGQGADANARQQDGATPLLWAAQRGNVSTARVLLDAGAVVDTANDYGVTPLAVASKNGNVPMVAVLLDAGADVNQKDPSGATSLMTAARTGNVALIKIFLAHKAHVNVREQLLGQTAMMWAAAAGHIDAARTLIEAGAVVEEASDNGFTPLLFAAREGDIPMVQLLMAHGADINTASYSGATALTVATVRDHVDLALFLLEHGSDPNAEDVGFSPLHWAVWKPESALIKDYVSAIEQGEWSTLGGIRNRSEKITLIRTLLRKGANVNARVKKAPPVFGGLGGGLQFYGGGSTVGATPFLLATHGADVEIMRLLLASGADPSLGTDDGSTTLMVAAGLGNYEENSIITDAQALEAVKICLAVGGDVNAANAKGNTALHGAAYLGRTGITRFLVEHGANPEPVNKKGITPMKAAEFSNESGMLPFYHPQTAALLKEMGATK